LTPTDKAVVLFEQAERKATHRGHVLSCMTGPNAALVLLEGYVKHPVHPVFNVPVPPSRLQERLGVRIEATDVVASFGGASFGGRFSLFDPLVFDHADGTEVVAAGHAFAVLWEFSIAFPNALEDRLRIGAKLSLVVLEGQHVVGSLIGNGFGDPLLTAHRIDSHAVQPATSRTSNSSGMAVISLDFSSVLTCPRVTPFSLAQALTM